MLRRRMRAVQSSARTCSSNFTKRDGESRESKGQTAAATARHCCSKVKKGAAAASGHIRSITSGRGERKKVLEKSIASATHCRPSSGLKDLVHMQCFAPDWQWQTHMLMCVRNCGIAREQAELTAATIEVRAGVHMGAIMLTGDSALSARARVL